MLTAVISLTLLGVLLGIALALAGRYLRVEGNPLAAEIEAMMPGSQCGQCGFPGCTGAAIALAEGRADVTLCPPGGKALAEAFATKLGVTVDLSGVVDKPPQIAFVQEATCIGCARCYKLCPTDAIVGSMKQIHTVIRDACTGCEKCVAICPTGCLQMQEIKPTLQTWYWARPQQIA